VANIGSGHINGNKVLNVGPAGDFLNDTMGVECIGTFAQLDVSDNTVRRNETLLDTPATSSWFAVRIGTPPRRGLIPVGAKLAFFAVGEKTYIFAGDKLAVFPRGREIVGLHGNFLEGYGTAPVIRVDASGALTLATNRCLLIVNVSQPIAQARAGAIIASGNYLKGVPQVPPVPAMILELRPENGPFTALGNISSGDILVNGNPLAGTTWAPLNVVAV
jgi:hypothetical protein